MASLAPAALRGALVATAITTFVALSAALVRLFPWLLDPSVTWRVATPFARSLSVVALEAALALGWPLGWAFATLGFVQRGEARVLALLGERPAVTVRRLGPQGALLALALAALSWSSAHESTEPGRIVSELIAEGKAACEAHSSGGAGDTPRTYSVPFLGATWLCFPGRPRLVGQGPGRLAGVVFSAADARASGDLARLELDDAHVTLAKPPTSLHVDALRLHGAAPFGPGSVVAPIARALSLSAAALLTSLAVVGVGLLQARGRILTLVTGAVGPMTALGLLRAAERLSSPLPFAIAPDWLVLGVPPLSVAAVLAVGWAGARLPALWHAASK